MIRVKRLTKEFDHLGQVGEGRVVAQQEAPSSVLRSALLTCGHLLSSVAMSDAPHIPFFLPGEQGGLCWQAQASGQRGQWYTLRARGTWAHRAASANLEIGRLAGFLRPTLISTLKTARSALLRRDRGRLMAAPTPPVRASTGPMAGPRTGWVEW